MGRDPGREDPEQKFRNAAIGPVITGNRTASCEIQVESCRLPRGFVPENWVVARILVRFGTVWSLYEL